ncbi:sensor histidine kinase [Microvirga mediterraneensis]|uniref:Blue-light-activated histidine kinase n=1 Tax=Microvirga mediterraneensis TaxID=2754695 RepID=A0A838BV39_9HYPH|nr:PAS domain-containing protein [Microvirga mediterraneensis]MBA1159120.1 PAS domain-containing protein [Microvirga mediterraneensis]
MHVRVNGQVAVPSTGTAQPRSPCLVGTLQIVAPSEPIDTGSHPDEPRLNAILNTMPQMVWSTRPDGFHDYYNDRWYEFTGMPHGSTDGERWSGMFHPDDQPRARARWHRSRTTGEPYEIEYRLRRHDGAYRWTLGRALPIRSSDGTIERWFGTCTDIHDLKLSEEQRELIARELSHRIKNIFAVVTSLVTLTSRGDPGAQSFAIGLVQRLSSLAHVHGYIQPNVPWEEAEPASRTALGLLGILVRPYQHDKEGAPGPGVRRLEERVSISGDDAPIGAAAGTALVLIVHELATNAIKYGSLSRPDGSVAIRGEALPEQQFRLTWQERGGPPVAGPPGRQGFGTLLAYRGATGQLGAHIEQDWSPDGLTVCLTMPIEYLGR